MYTEPGTVRTILVQAKDLRKKYERKDVMDDMMKALQYFPFFQRVDTRSEKGMFALTFHEEHMGRMKEVINKIRKNTKLKFKYIPPPGVEDVIETEVTQNEVHTQTATKHLPTFACMRTIHVARMRVDEEQDLLVELLKQINEVGWDKHLQRVTRMWDVGPAGHFTITFKTTKSKEIIEKIWNAKVKEGRLGYEMIDENPQREFALKLDRLPEEVPTEAMEAYLSKYVKNPKMEITVRDLSEHGLGKVEIGEATVTHKGLRRAIPRMVWVGPGVRARVTSMTEKPWDSYKVICSLCKGDGHKAWDCPKQTNCFRCKTATHKSADCPYCEACRKYGHLSEGCTANQNSSKNTDEDKTEKTQDDNEKPEKADQQERPPRQKEQPKHPKPAPKVTSKKAKKKSKSKAKPTAAEEQITAATTGSENEDESEIECMDEVEVMDEEEFHEAMGTKRKYPDTDPDSSTVSKKEKSNGKGES